MGRKSSIDTQLSDADRAEFRRLLGEGRMTIDALTAWLDERGYEISRSAVGRAAQRQAAVAARLRESRAITEGLVQELGEAATQGQQGRLLVELSRSLVFDFLVKAQAEDVELDPKSAMMLAKGLAEFSRAARYDQDFEEKVETRARKLAAEMAAEKAGEMVEKAGPSAGLSAETIGKLKAEFLGMGG